jgi:hypothetical protein
MMTRLGIRAPSRKVVEVSENGSAAAGRTPHNIPKSSPLATTRFRKWRLLIIPSSSAGNSPPHSLRCLAIASGVTRAVLPLKCVITKVVIRAGTHEIEPARACSASPFDLTCLLRRVKKFAFCEHVSRDVLKATYRLPTLPPLGDLETPEALRGGRHEGSLV